jgi:LacI family transcriptional regulator, fructose operon transcriptional repressor
MPIITRKPTIYDIAKLSGASPSTVSAVLSGNWSMRRIKEATVENIQKIASEQGYTINLQARGLRQARSRLAGMIIPMHDNRFFSSLSQSFDLIARERGLCPVIASTLRDPKEEIRIVEMLLAYAIDSLFIAGATDPDALARLCRAANLPHIFIDLPSSHAPSVVTNNFHGAELLARKILSDSKPQGGGPRGKPYFLGGALSDYATARRAAAFRAVAEENGGAVGEDQIVQCGYAPRNAAMAIEALCTRLGGLPASLFVNSITVFEGVMSYFVALPPSAFENSVIGCFDYDPFAAFLQFPVTMVRQNSNQLIEQAYAMLDQGSQAPRLVEIEPDLIAPRTIHSNALNALG